MESLVLPKFLLYVDRQIHTKGLNLLKLSLYQELAWGYLEACTKPSEIFHLLQNKNKGSALQKFLFALKAIGGSARGKCCVEEAKKQLSESQYPRPLDLRAQTKAFHFFQVLVKISRKLPDEAERKMKKHFSNHDMIRSNYRQFEFISELFIQLYQATIISEDDSEALHHELKKCKQYYKEGAEEQARLDKCLLYLTIFHMDSPMDPFMTGLIMYIYINYMYTHTLVQSFLHGRPDFPINHFSQSLPFMCF